MVAISLYRGNLHRVADVPRRWPMPPPAISVPEFRRLLERRSRALSRLGPPTPPAAEVAKPPPGEKEEGTGDNGCPKPVPASGTADDGAGGEFLALPEATAGEREEAGREEGGGAREGLVIGPSCPPASTSTALENTGGAENGGRGDNNVIGDVGFGGKVEASSLDIINDSEEQKRDLKKKLEILNEKKHDLVQMLKQILNAEEEIKKSISMQPPLVRPSFLLQTEATIDGSSVTKLAASKMNIEVNFVSDAGVAGESEEIASHNNQLLHSQHAHNTSPSSASAFNRPAQGFHHNLVITPRASSTSTGTASPSRFASSGHQGQLANLPPVTISGTHFFASSPSPAASGGSSSVFRDSRLTSPQWN